MPLAIDLNCDLGEDPAHLERDLALFRVITSANIACGGHAGDESTMAALVAAATNLGVAIGAHPGYPDQDRFGRVELSMSPREVEKSVAAQIATLACVAAAAGVAVTHVKPHGALYHAAMRRPDIARAIAHAAAHHDGLVSNDGMGVPPVSSDARADRRPAPLSADTSTGPRLILVGQAGAPALNLWRSLGHPIAAEAFADRRYEPDGSLRSRTLPGALLTDPADAAVQAVRLILGQGPRAAEGSAAPLTLSASIHTLCIHSDTPNAFAIANAVRAALEYQGVAVVPLPFGVELGRSSRVQTREDFRR